MMKNQSKTSLPDLEVAIHDTLAAIAEIDRWYDLERKDLGSRPEPIRKGLAEEIERRCRQNREPYVRHLAHLYQMMVSARIFGDPALLSSHRQDWRDWYLTALHVRPSLFKPAPLGRSASTRHQDGKTALAGDEPQP